jgi:hypothetical protein
MIAMTPLRTIALALGVALPVGALLSFLPEWRGEPGPMECTALVNTILGEHRWIPPNRLHEELVKRGVTLPSPPSLSLAPSDSGSKVKSRLREYESAKKAYQAKWEEIEGSPVSTSFASAAQQEPGRSTEDLPLHSTDSGRRSGSVASQLRPL